METWHFLFHGRSTITLRGMRLLIGNLLSLLLVAAAPVTWDSASTGKRISGEMFAPPASTRPLPTVVYLKNLAVPRIGRESDASIIADLTKSGCLVLVLDYGHDPKAISPDLNADILKLRRDIADKKHKTLLVDQNVDPDHLVILCEGFRLKR